MCKLEMIGRQERLKVIWDSSEEVQERYSASAVCVKSLE